MEKDKTTIRELPLSERPYEKCRAYGPEVLSDGELLAVIIRTGSPGECCVSLAQRILKMLPEQSLAGLCQMSLEELKEIKGVGEVKAIQLLSLVEITKRIMANRISMQQFVCDEPKKIAAYFMPVMGLLETEQVRLLILNGRNVLQRELVISEGSFNSSFAAPREIFYYALKHKAVNIILLHNHPSGDPTPSRDDFTLTKRIAETGKLIGIPLIDHIIIGKNQYISIRECGYLP